MTNILCFGFNAFGQLLQSSEPKDVTCKIRTSRVSHVSLNWSSSIFILGESLAVFIIFLDYENIGNELKKVNAKKCVSENGEIFKKGFINKEFNEIEQIKTPFKERVIKVVASRQYDFYLCENGFCWMYDPLKKEFTEIHDVPNMCSMNDGNDGDFTNIVDIARRNYLFILLSDKGVIYNMNKNEKILPNPNLKVIRVACGAGHSVCLTESGSVFTWGAGSRGELGNGSLEPVCNPELLRALDGIKIINVACGEWHTAAVSEFGDLYTWGWNSDAQLGFEPSSASDRENKESVSIVTEPRIVNWFVNNPEGPLVKQVACGIRHTIILLDDDTVWGCGWNKYGQIDPQSKDAVIYPIRQIVMPNGRVPYKIDCIQWNSIIYFK